jgi:predicted DNA-binding transcriptional regulator AlpA
MQTQTSSVALSTGFGETKPSDKVSKSPRRRLNVKEAAAYLGLSVSKTNKLRTYGGGPKYYKLDHRVVYEVADLDAWVAARVRANTSQNHAA